MRIRTMHGALLFAVGFMSGVFGISAVNGTSPVALVSPHHTLATAASPHADLCAPDQKKTEKEQIFFLSCGGMY